MDVERAAELTELRRRVYGPASEIDPRDLARLDELEAAAVTPRIEERTPDDGAPDPGGAADADRAPARRRRRAALWLGSVLVAVLATVGVETGIHVDPATTVAVLPLRPVGDAPLNLSKQATAGSDWQTELDGVVVTAHSPELSLATGDGVCLSSETREDGTTTVRNERACGAGPVPARLPLRVTPDMPRALRDAFPVGTTLEFVLAGDSVRVLSHGR